MKEMENHSLLKYSDKWIEFGFLKQEVLNKQIKEYRSGVDNNLEHYRYATFIHWLSEKQRFSIEEIQHYIELAKEDEEEMMAGSAVKCLFESEKLEENQYEYVKTRLPEFGEWTKKIISRQDLKKEIQGDRISINLIERCWEHKEKFKENILIELLLEKIEDVELLRVFERFNCSKKIKSKITRRINEL